MKKGMVVLVGAGPGDTDLITVKGIECLKAADVVIYDRLLDDRLLAICSANAELIYVGKVMGKHTKPQNEINRILLEKARNGKMVVRLKGGDPFVFGRGGEEAEMLAKHSITFEIIPGITSAIGVPAYAGIPVTHRGIASSFAVITGHEYPNKKRASINWKSLATGVDTLIFLMGMEHLPEIVSKLIEFERPAETPVAVIKDGTKAEQRTVIGTLADIVSRVQVNHLTAPAVIVVGNVVKLRDTLNWFEARPLSGKRILVTRARHQAEALSQLLTQRGAIPVELPLIKIQPNSKNKELEQAVSNLNQYDWIIFTSVNGVSAFWQSLKRLKKDSRTLHRCRICAIGPATAETLESRGVIPDYVPDTYTTEGIIAGLRQMKIRGQRFLLPRADKADKALVQSLISLGASAEEVTAYYTIPAMESIAEAKRKLIAGELDVITFTSSSTVTNLVAAFGGGHLPAKQAKIACIGPKTAETASKAGLNIDILADEQTISGLVKAIENYFRRKS